MVLGEARRAGVVGEVAEPDRARLVDQGAEQALADRKVPDPVDEGRRETDVDELGQPAVRGEHAERGVAGADELPGRLHDAVQHLGQGQPARDHVVRAQETPQPPLGGEDLLCALDQLRQQLIELQPRQVREGQIPAVGVLTGSGEPGVGPEPVVEHRRPL